jgi:glycogen(starch) synthase
MKIGLVTAGGITQVFRNWPERRLGAALVRRGHAVRALTLYDPSIPHLDERNEEIEGIGVARVRPRWAEMWRGLRSLGDLDLLHLHHLRNDLALPTALYARLRRIPLAFTLHGILHDPFVVRDRDYPLAQPLTPERVVRRARDIPRAGARAGWRSYRMHRALYLADRVIALSEHEREVVETLGVDGRRISVLPQWVEPAPDAACELPRRPAILFIGQFKYRKGFDLLLRALPRVRERFAGLGAYFVTQNPLHRHAFERLIEEGGLRDACELLGQVEEGRKWALLRAADLYVLPTRYEGFGLPVFEAMEAGCPVVTTRVPVLTEMLSHGEHALLAQPEDPDSLAEEMLRVLEDAAIRARLVAGGKRLVRERYSEAAVVPSYEAVYRQTIAGR